MKGWPSIKKLLLNLDIIISGVNFVALVVLTFVGVVFRYVLSDPISWIEEMQLACSVWIVFASAGVAFRTGNHVAIEIFVDAMPKVPRRIIMGIIDIAFAAIMIYFLIQSAGYVNLFIESGRVSNILKLPYKYVYSVVPVSCVLMLVNYFLVRFEEIKGNGGHEEDINE